MSNYQDLIFYQKAREGVKAVDVLVKSWPKTMQAPEISRQLFRSAASIGANVAEGHGRHQGTEYIHYLIIAQGSANETEHWLRTAQDCGLGNSEKIVEILKVNNEVIKMITSTIITVRSKLGAKNLREDNADYVVNQNFTDND